MRLRHELHFAMPARLLRTIANRRWLLANAEQLQQCFPEEWAPLQEFNAFEVGEHLRRVGIQWHDEGELAGVLTTLQAVGIMRLSVGRKLFGKNDIDVVKRGPLVLTVAP